MATVKINTAYNVPIDFELSGLDRRFFAWLIDFGIRFFYLLIVGYFIRSIMFNDSLSYEAIEERKIVYQVLLMLPLFFYFLLFEIFFNGQSIGKAILKIRVVSIEGYKPTVIQYLTRWILRLVDLGFISLGVLTAGSIYTNWIGVLFIIPNIIAIIMLINSKAEQRLGDIVSGTVVIKLKPTTMLSDTIFENVSKTYKVVYTNVLKLSDRDITIIKTALQNYDKSGNDNTLWLITDKLKTVLDITQVNEPYYMLETVLKDYNYLTSN